ncbi:hypothetical protein [Actinokineospora bangkokensis]|uniref:DUF8017 domain-containing protein n=1 Tax=Actinokineospora bangkokensis TaxID=1193682 RepID=A0A1Q9LQ37_9PSEU|nr:hypothetical protein [Actinokineospora bangkokensis]OLR94103.1 hypothetical protein BJP25_09780 [Actinokineospora bangkokensis]
MRKRLAVSIGALALVSAVLGAVALLAPDPEESADLPSATSVSSTRTRDPAPEAPLTPGWRVVVDPSARVAYDVPPDWVLADDQETLESSNGVRLGHLADYGTYACQGAEYGRAFSGSGLTTGTPDDAAVALAAAIAGDQYSDANQTARVTVSRPTPVVRDGTRGTLVRADAEATADSADKCAGTKGVVAVVALATPAGTAVVVVGADTERGEAEGPEVLAGDALRAMTDSVRPRG